MSKECECEPEHSVAKLGHCLDCPCYTPRQPSMIEFDLASTIGCPPKHRDGTEHNFDWATYTDETLSTGVCRCGLRQIDVDLMTLP